jgi:hypothetical protein
MCSTCWKANSIANCAMAANSSSSRDELSGLGFRRRRAPLVDEDRSEAVSLWINSLPVIASEAKAIPSFLMPRDGLLRRCALA